MVSNSLTIIGSKFVQKIRNFNIQFELWDGPNPTNDITTLHQYTIREEE